MRVDRFSIGFGPALFKRTYGETDFTIGPIPFGGFVQINGMLVSEDVDADDPRSYPNRPVWQRFLTIFAGPATNYLAAIVLAFVFYNIVGVRAETARYVVGGVATGEGFDAEGKLEAGDIIAKVDGEVVHSRFEGRPTRKGFVARVQESDGKPMALTIIRDGSEMEVSVIAKPNPAFEKVKDKPVEERPNIPAYRIGIVLDEERADVGVLGALGHALIYPVLQTKLIVKNLYDMATKEEARKGAQLSSVVGITAEVKRHIDRGFTYLLQILMVLNIYLGLFNLFPLPALDGGRLVFLGYEMITRRRANPKIEATVHMVGIMALMILLIVVTYGDIKRLITG